MPPGLEAVCIEIDKPCSRPFVVITVYRPPNAQTVFFNDLEQLVKTIDDENKEIYILGDLNCDLLKSISDQPTTKLKSIFEMYQLTQLIDEATRITTTSNTLIDHFITNTQEKICKSGVIHTGISDHSMIYAIRKINITIHKNVENISEIRNMKNFNGQNFLNDLLQQPWENIYFFADNPNGMWDIWKELFLEILDKHAPLQKKKIKSKSTPWITSNIKNMINTRDKLKRKAIIIKLKTDWENCKRMRNNTSLQIRQAKKEYYSNKITCERQDPKSTWKTINNLLGKETKHSKVNELNINDKNLTSPSEIAEGFNEFFSEIGPKLAEEIGTCNSNFKQYIQKNKSEFAAFEAVTVNNIYRLLCQLPSAKATGIDNISSKIIKIAAPVISSSLTYVFNQSITLCVFPNDWKIARVTPIFKNGKQNLPGNYRPISVLPAISKVMEHIMYTQLYEYLTKNKLLSEHQFGF